MWLARPPDGFEIYEPEGISIYIAGQAEIWPALPRRWAAIKERLKMTGHRDGTAYRGDRGRLVFVEAADARIPSPRIVVQYRILGDQLKIMKIVVTGV
jgi:hypothetical protein